MNTNQRIRKPKISHKNGHCTVTHREYLSDIVGYTGYTFPTNYTQEYIRERINPCNAALFPWLCGMAGQYETYKFKKLMFDYVSTCPTTTSGYVIIAIDYDPSDLAPTSKVEVMSYDGAVRANAWSNTRNISSPENLSKYHRYYCSYETQRAATAGSVRTSDVGTLNVIAQGQQNVDNIGELYVEYEVDFFTPQLNTYAANGGSLYIAITGNVLNFNTASYHGNLNLIPYNTNALLFRQGFQGVVILRQIGTGIDVVPGISISLGSVVQSRYSYKAAGGTSAVDVLRIRANAQAVLTPAIGVSTTLTNYYMEFYPTTTEMWDAL